MRINEGSNDQQEWHVLGSRMEGFSRYKYIRRRDVETRNERLEKAASELLAMLKRMATPEVSRCEVNRSMVDADRECGEQNRCEPCRAALEAEALIARVEGGK